MGFPSRRARTRASNRAPGELLTAEEWKGTDAEQHLVSIHPERFEDVNQVALSTLFIIGNEVYGSRRNLGSIALGVQMDKQTGDLGYTADDKGNHAKTTLTRIIRELGAIPEGFADIAEPVQRKQTNRQLKYKCAACGTIIRAAGSGLEVVCLHGGKPQHGQMGAKFEPQPNGNGANLTPEQKALQPAQPATEAAKTTEAVPATPATQAAPASAAKPPVGRNFGRAAAAQAQAAA